MRERAYTFSITKLLTMAYFPQLIYCCEKVVTENMKNQARELQEYYNYFVDKPLHPAASLHFVSSLPPS